MIAVSLLFPSSDGGSAQIYVSISLLLGDNSKLEAIKTS